MEQKLPKEFKENWITALKSGDYLQGQGFLYDKYQSNIKGKPVMCCLGVAEAICGTELNILDEVVMSYNLKEKSNVPELLRKQWMDNAININISSTLAIMNDGTGTEKRKSFNEIADWIEQNL